MNNNVIQIDKNFGPMHALQNEVHEALKGSKSKTEPLARSNAEKYCAFPKWSKISVMLGKG